MDEPVIEREGYRIHELMLFDINQVNVADPETYVRFEEDNYERSTGEIYRASLRCCHSGYKSRVDRYACHVNTYNFAIDNTSTWTLNARANLFPRVATASKVDYDTMQPYFCWLPIGIIKKTSEATTQWAKMPASTHLFKRYFTPHMFANYYRRNEVIASDTIFADVPAIGSGVTCAQIYCGMNSTVTDVFGLKKERYL